jgi:hypothetical protein
MSKYRQYIIKYYTINKNMFYFLDILLIYYYNYNYNYEKMIIFLNFNIIFKYNHYMI